MERTAKKNFLIDIFYTSVIILIVLAGSFVVVKYLLPFVIGIFIAFAVQKPSEYLSRKTKINKGYISVLLSFALYLAAGSVLIFLIYRIFKFTIGFTDLFPQLADKINGIFLEIQTKYSDVFSLLPDNVAVAINSALDNAFKNFTSDLVTGISEFAGAIAKKMPSFFISSIVTLVATCYIAKDFGHLLKFAKTLLGHSKAEKLRKIKNILFGSVFKLFKGYLLLSFIAFCELYVGFLVIGIDYPLALAAVIALVDLLPVIGTGTVMVPWAIISALIGEVNLAIGLAVLYIITVIVRNFLEPKIIGMQIGINSLFTLIFMFAGLKILGVAGLIIFPIVFIVTVRYYKDEMQEGLSV